MKLVHKILIGSVSAVVVGAVLLDLRLQFTGATVLTLGVFGIVLGPTVSEL